MSAFAGIETIATERLLLEPLAVTDVNAMADVLADERLHEFIGGRPATREELRVRYEQLVAGSPDPGEIWFNWVVRRREDARAVGTVQATLIHASDRWTAEVAWVIGVRWQNQGFASEAARALVDWLERRGAHEIVAHIHPAHRASEAVATRIGLLPTESEVDGERVWRAVERR